jgi:valyl-tRNA synthetase
MRCHLTSKQKKDVELLRSNEQVLKNLAGINTLVIDKVLAKKKNTATVVVGTITGSLPLGGLIDIDKEKDRMLDQIKEQKKASKALSGRLKNKDFVNKAPRDVVEKEKVRLDSINSKIKELEKAVTGLK